MAGFRWDEDLFANVWDDGNVGHEVLPADVADAAVCGCGDGEERGVWSCYWVKVGCAVECAGVTARVDICSQGCGEERR